MNSDVSPHRFLSVGRHSSSTHFRCFFSWGALVSVTLDCCRFLYLSFNLYIESVEEIMNFTRTPSNKHTMITERENFIARFTKQSNRYASRLRWVRHLCAGHKIEVGSVDENGCIGADVLLRRIFSLCQTGGKITWGKDVFLVRMKKSSRYYPERSMLFFLLSIKFGVCPTKFSFSKSMQ